MNAKFLPKIATCACMAAALVFTGCSAAMDAVPESGGNLPEGMDKHYPLNISLDGKVGWINDRGTVVPVYGLKVTMIDGEGVRTDSARTNYNGRFLIEHEAVAVGYTWENRHIQVEITDDRSPQEQVGTATYATRRIRKEINSAPGYAAVLTMDDIIVERIEPATAPE